MSVQKFTSNPLSGVVNKQDGKAKNRGLYDSNGNKILDMQGREWSENDQLGYDLLMAQMNMQYQNDLLNFQNEYNSPENQARLMRDAGLNPDLQNISFQPSSTSSAQMPQTKFGIGENLQKSQSIISGVSQIFTLANNFVGVLQNARVQSNQVELSDLQVLESLSNYARPMVKTYYSRLASGAESSNLFDVSKVSNPFRKGSKLHRMYNSAFSRVSSLYDVVKDSYKDVSELQDNRTKVLSYKGLSSNGSRDFVTDDQVARDFLDPIISAKVKSLKSGLDSSSARNNFDSEYWNSRNGVGSAGFDERMLQYNTSGAYWSKESNKSDVLRKRLEHDELEQIFHVKSVRREIIENLYRDYKHGSDFAGGLLMALDLYMYGLDDSTSDQNNNGSFISDLLGSSE